jgi:histidinol-phosphate aminotransferase
LRETGGVQFSSEHWEKNMGIVRPDLLRFDPYVPPASAPADMLSLHLNENMYGASPSCLAAIQDMTREDIASYRSASVTSLAETIALRWQLDSAGLGIGEGASGILRQLFLSTLGHGDTVLCPRPGWNYYRTLATLCEARFATYPLVDRGRDFNLDVDVLLSLAQSHQAKMVLINSPHMPSASTVQPADIALIARELPACLIAVDEAYWGFTDVDPGLHTLLGYHDNLILVRSFSKLYGLASLRVGFSLSNARLQKALRAAEPLFGVSYPAQLMAIAALRDLNYYSQVALKVRRTEKIFTQTLRQQTPLTPYTSAANFILIRTNSIGAKNLVERMTTLRTYIRHCDGYGMPGHVRITIGTHKQMLRVANELTGLCGAIEQGA